MNIGKMLAIYLIFRRRGFCLRARASTSGFVPSGGWVRAKSGQTILPAVLLLGGLIVVMALTLAFLSNAFLLGSYGFQISEKARAVVASGVYDALLRLDRNKDISGAYSVPLGNYSASVTITQDSPSIGQATITSISTILNRQRKVAAIVSRPSSTGQITLTSWQYIP